MAGDDVEREQEGAFQNEDIQADEDGVVFAFGNPDGDGHQRGGDGERDFKSLVSFALSRDGLTGEGGVVVLRGGLGGGEGVFVEDVGGVGDLGEGVRGLSGDGVGQRGVAEGLGELLAVDFRGFGGGGDGGFGGGGGEGAVSGVSGAAGQGRGEAERRENAQGEYGEDSFHCGVYITIKEGVKRCFLGDI